MLANTQQLQRRALQEGTKQASTFAVAIPIIAITTVVMGLRLDVRLRLVQGGLGTDDRTYSATPRKSTDTDLNRSSVR
jgi:hypothetical protein